MPAKSKAQQALFAIAAHAPEKLYKANQSLANLPASTLHEFAATKVKTKPEHVRPAKKASPSRWNYGK